jgi:DNA-nicking Smr family endonuclease
MKVNALADLKSMQKHLAEQQRLREERAAQAKLDAARQAAAKDLFSRAVGKVQRLPETGRMPMAKLPAEPIAKQQALDDKAVLIEAISDQFDAATLLEVDDSLSFRRPGVGADVTAKLRKGEWAIQKQIDLHGLRRDDARETLSAFIHDCFKQGLRCVRVVHGKGLGSPGKTPVLKSRVHSWLVQKNEILAFVQARPMEGGAGALVVLLNRH